MTVLGVLPRAQVDHRQLERNPHLVRGKTDAGRGMHGFDHVLDQAVQGLVDFSTRAVLFRSTGSG